MTSVYLKLPYGIEGPDGTRGLRCDGETVADALAAAFAQDGTLKRQVYASDGRLRVTILLNGWKVGESDAWRTKLESGDRLSLLPHISGQGHMEA